MSSSAPPLEAWDFQFLEWAELNATDSLPKAANGQSPTSLVFQLARTLAKRWEHDKKMGHFTGGQMTPSEFP